MTDRTRIAGWPYDAKQDDPLAALRIPVISNPFPRWKYEVALVIGGEDGLYAPALRPDEAETAMIAAYIGYRREWYNPGWREKMLRRPLDTDSGTNTVVLQKRAEGDWCYRRMTWITGPLMMPPRGSDERLSLEQLLDRINGYHDSPNPRWEAYKAAHPEAFPERARKARS
jgi:hypothetical protein